ncbi:MULTISPECIES: hypothetical protein [Sporosarcina]|uniref:hypothetical protein n=1 Tax=Sporosarcina TaxID=1569 RepID=UPI00058C7CF6|nr:MULTISPECIES: hypothetical protein [Sporosarcina]WJY27236.1 hypothetical protein QWT68_14540 [Sporosarcina sp. 0.2-SM1T-5]
MKRIALYVAVLLAVLTVAGCSNTEKEGASQSAVSVKDYSPTDRESELISKTGINQVEYFTLNATLAEGEDLQYSVEVYRNGKLSEERTKTYGDPERNYKDAIISFGVDGFNDEEGPFELINGVPGGTGTSSYPNMMTSFTFNKLVKGKIDLVKDKPVYLASWQGTTKDSLSSHTNETGELPEGLEDSELVFLYKLLWTDAEE